jgi:hypothetical protein
MNELINKIYEDSRQQLILLDGLNSKCNSIAAEGYLQLKLKLRISELIKTAMADFLILNDLLYQIINSNSENEIQFLLEAEDEI